MPKRDPDRDVELDKKIQALRRKNEVLMKRYQEVEEDKKKAQEEGMAQQSRKGKAEDLTITINKSTSQDTRVVVTKLGTGGSPSQKGQQEAGLDGAGDVPLLSNGRGRRKQLMVTMVGKKGKRVVSERLEKRPGPADGRTEDDVQQSTGRGKRDTAAQDELWQVQSADCQESGGQQARTDLTIPTSKEEQDQYLLWKKERQEIDKERLARHKNSKGQWRRAWDMDKTENMFSDKSLPEKDRGPPGRGGKNARRGHPRSNGDSRGQETRDRDEVKEVPVVSSKAKGKDRLTGRARRWDGNEGEEHLKASETSLEEFLEELDALTDPEVCDHKDGDQNIKSPSSPDAMRPEEVVSSPGSEGAGVSNGPTGSPSAAPPAADTLSQAKAGASSPLAPEKKVRFSEELVQEVPARPVTDGQNSPRSDIRGPGPLKASSPSKIKREAWRQKQAAESVQDHVGGLPDQGGLPAPVAQPQSSSEPRAPAHQQQTSGAPVVSETECTVKDSVPAAVTISPPAVTISPPAVTNTPPAVPNSPPAVPISPPAVPISPPAVPISPPAVPISPPAVPNSPPAVPNSPPAVPNSPPAVSISPPAVPISPPAVPAVPISPPAVPDSPPAVPNAPPAVPISPPAVPAVPDSPPAVPISPPAVPAVPHSPPAVPAVPDSPPAVPDSPPAVSISPPAVPAVPISPPAVPAVPISPPAVPISPPAVPAVPDSPPSVPISPPAVPDSPPAVPISPPAVPNAPPAVPISPPAVPAVPDSPPAVPAVPDSPPSVPISPPAVPVSPPAVPISSPAVPNSPPAVPNSPPAVPDSPPAGKACTSLQESCLQPVERPKSSLSSRNTEELIDAGLSVLSLESGATHPTHTTSTDKARENGKIV